jgi:hypothetical protein
MTEEIFYPLGMTQTTLNISLQTKRNLAKRYDSEGNLLPFSFCDTPGAGNVSSTVNDLIHFGMFHLNGKSENHEPVLNKNTIQLMQQKQYPDNSNDRNNYGLGWFINDKDYKYKMIYHAGGMDGVGAMLKLIPSKNIAVAAIMNCYGEFMSNITDSILNELIPDLRDINQMSEPSESETTKIIKQDDLLGKWEGNIETYGEKIPITLIFQEDGDIHVYTKVQFESINLKTNIYNVQHRMLLNKWFFENGHLMGWYSEQIPDEYLSRCPHTTLLDLYYQSGKLKGTAVALASSSRMYYAISHYLELERKGQK